MTRSSSTRDALDGQGGQSPTDLILAEHAAEIRRLGKRAIQDVIEIGRRLTACKHIVGHGNWLPWLDREFGWSEATARNFMRVYELVQCKSANFADLNLPVSTLYVLSAPNTPEQARQEIAERIDAGEKPSCAEVKDAIKCAKGKKTSVAAAHNAATTTSGTPAEEAAKSAKRRKAYYEKSPDPADHDRRVVDNDHEHHRDGDLRPDRVDHAVALVVCAQDGDGDSVRRAGPDDDERSVREGEATAAEYIRLDKERQLARDEILTEYFAAASGSDVYERIPTARRCEVIAAFTIEDVIAVFGEQLRAKLPANPIPKLREMDNVTAASTIYEAFGASRFESIVQQAHDLHAPKGKKAGKRNKSDKPVKATPALDQKLIPNSDDGD